MKPANGRFRLQGRAMTWLKRVRPFLLLLVLLPALAWTIVKPVRLLVPQWGVAACSQRPVCVEEPSRTTEAEALYADAMTFVSHRVGTLSGRPRMVFCSTQACADYFGLGARSAVTLATIGTVIGPRAWKPHYVRHELIHYLQAQTLGWLPLLTKPKWFVEGMAYGLSEDPRTPLPPPFEDYRRAFFVWYGGAAPGKLWLEAGKL